jgi:hypothetical protein
MEQTRLLKSDMNTRLQPLEKAHYVWSILGKALLTVVTGAVLALVTVFLKSVM